MEAISMEKVKNLIKSIFERIVDAVIDYLMAFACMGTVADTRVYFTFALIMLFFTIYAARKVFHI